MQVSGRLTCAASHPASRPIHSSAPRPASGADRPSRWAQRCPQAQRVGQASPEKAEDEGAAGSPGSGNLMSRGLEDLGTLAGNLLMNAASWRVVRGQTYCVQCRGTGRVTCTACQGAGIMQPEKVRMNQIRHAAGKLKVLLGVNDAKMNDSDWMMSNRCKRCHGSGALTCKQCDGSGVRGPAPGAGR